MSRRKAVMAAGGFGLALALGSGCAPLVNRVERPRHVEDRPNSSQFQRFLSGIAAARPTAPVSGIVHGEPVVADYAANGRCGTVLLTYQNLDYSETWNVCPEGIVTRSSPGTGKLPTSAEFKVLRHVATRGAWRDGQAELYYATYQITARTIGTAAEPGCVMVENAVKRDGDILQVSTERVCGGD